MCSFLDDDEERVRQAIEGLDARQDLRELHALLLELQELLLGVPALDRVLQEVLQPAQPFDALLDGAVIGERAAEPAHVDERHADPGGLLRDRLLGLALGADDRIVPPWADSCPTNSSASRNLMRSSGD